jgi:uncharacterized protein YoxC
MELVIVMLIVFCFFLFERVRELRKQITNLEKILKSMNDDLNMVNRTMNNMYREQKEKKQILRG